MRIWATEIYAKHNITGETATFCGQNVQAPTKELAIKWCKKYAGYLHVTDEIVMEIPTIPGTNYEPDWANAVDYETIQNN